jgi:hypothetical protein
MALQEIIWDDLYAAQPAEREFVEERIRLHFARKGLERRGVEKAKTRYVFRILLSPFSAYKCS